MTGAEPFPFPVAGSVPAGPAGGDLTIEVWAAAPRPDALLPAHEVINLFTAAVNEQLYTPTGLRSSLELIDEQVAADGAQRSYRFLATAVAPLAFRGLLSLLTQTHYAGDELAGLAVRASRTGDAVDLRALAGPGIIAPERALAPPFEFEQRIAEGEAGFCTITARFRQAVAREQFIAVREGFGIWDRLVMLGAFKPDFAAQEDFWEEYGQTAHQTADTVEHATPAYDGSAGAVNAIVNFLCRVHAELAPIALVEIE